ncbi:MAG TPA: nitrate/sulfonate/bicarbonate ABC transporter ATP-binding protein [Lachnospiraceae bacterium]|uniref:ABC transporter ATP-binding protein n=1 Tax=Anaerosporobacter sp. TaxID=1872529 RepID=UPI000EBBDF86|nr:ABC transporter ATP-binding protein [Anaerosporobacter sp.]HAB59508.1 nitrate/sulfonate/bicarbonate ABC transporter ATP-binding protein [Lachnospiraceae bacterium]
MLLEIKNLNKRYKEVDSDVLQNINLTIVPGEFICIIGPSGCGKTTLLNIIAGLEIPTSGEVYIDGTKVTSTGADRTVMFQEHALYPWLNVMDNVKFGMKLAGVRKKELDIRAEKYLKMVHLWKFRNYSIHELSGGMKQRTSLARALTLGSKMLLMDEPFSSLDKQTINRLRAELEEIWRETNKTIIYITHSVEEAVYFADRIVELSDNPGKIKKIYTVDLPRPRQIDSDAFVALRKKILVSVMSEVKSFAEVEYDKE